MAAVPDGHGVRLVVVFPGSICGSRPPRSKAGAEWRGARGSIGRSRMAGAEGNSGRPRNGAVWGSGPHHPHIKDCGQTRTHPLSHRPGIESTFRVMSGAATADHSPSPRLWPTAGTVPELGPLVRVTSAICQAAPRCISSPPVSGIARCPQASPPDSTRALILMPSQGHLTVPLLEAPTWRRNPRPEDWCNARYLDSKNTRSIAKAPQTSIGGLNLRNKKTPRPPPRSCAACSP